MESYEQRMARLRDMMVNPGRYVGYGDSFDVWLPSYAWNSTESIPYTDTGLDRLWETVKDPLSTPPEWFPDEVDEVEPERETYWADCEGQPRKRRGVPKGRWLALYLSPEQCILDGGIPFETRADEIIPILASLGGSGAILWRIYNDGTSESIREWTV